MPQDPSDSPSMSNVPEILDIPDDDAASQPSESGLHVRSDSTSPTEAELPLPVWMRESSKSFKWKWVPLPLRKAARTTAEWVKGPKPPRNLRITPLFPTIQEAPIKVLDRFVPKRRHRIVLLILTYFCWALIWSLMLRHANSSGSIKGYGTPASIWCGASFWNGGNGCGLNGNECRPFASAHLTFRCPANCKSVQLLNPHTVGNETLNYQSLVVGGRDPDDQDSDPVYRADSFICQAAIHAGVTTNDRGGCGVAVLTGTQPGFHSSSSHGIESTGFPASFPKSFKFLPLSDSQTQCARDSRWPTFAVTASFLVVISLFTTSPAAFFFSTFFILIFHVGLVSDPPYGGSTLDLLSTLASRLLPASFIAYILFITAAVPLLTGLTAQVEKTVLYLGFAFIGALNNYTFAPLIPIERLTPHDIKAQPGAPFALAIIICILLAIAGGQVHYIRVSGLMPKYLRIYISFVVGLLILVAIPGLRVRIHHYILAMLLMPGTFTQTRACLCYQGLLLGLFVNGVARWGFSAIIQTPEALGEPGGGAGGSWWGAKSPNVTAVVGPHLNNITFNWGALPDTGVEGVSILMNDVEKWRGYVDEELYRNDSTVTMKRSKKREQERQFFRFAWMKGRDTGRYSKVGTWDERGVWHPIPS